MQVKRNKTTVYALPSIHLPLTREARTWCGARDYCPFAMVVGMKRLVGVKQSLRLDGRKV